MPASSEFRRVRIGGAVYGYVLANGAVHVLDERGEVAVPAHYRAAVGRKYFGLASGAQPGVEASSGPPEVVLSAPGNDEFMAAFGPVRE
ncbi:MAG: hypothetical protein HY996_03810 [Micrococcales bacterium]|nr:hypothetical protein [Micrococcales bacterium]